MSEPDPKLVAQVELDRPLAGIDCRRDQGGSYRTAWILVRRGGRPLGNLELESVDGQIPVDVLRQALEARFPQTDPVPGARPPVADEDLPTITVIVPTAMSRIEELKASIEHLQMLDYPNFEIIVVDNRRASAPATDTFDVRVVRETRPGISAARNAGLAVAKGEIVAFTDDDVEVDPGWLRALGSRFVSDPDLSAVNGLVVPYELETPAQIWFEESGAGLDRQYHPLVFELQGSFRIRRTETDTGQQRTHSLYAMGELGMGSNMAFRTAILREAGEFDLTLGAGTATRGGEDLAILVELLTSGHQLAYEPSAIVLHKHRRTLEALTNQIYGYGTGLTAMLTAITLRNPRHLVGLASVVPAWLRSLRDPKSAKRVNRSDDYPAGFGRLEMKGMAMGPVTYLQSRRYQRRWHP